MNVFVVVGSKRKKVKKYSQLGVEQFRGPCKDEKLKRNKKEKKS